MSEQESGIIKTTNTTAKVSPKASFFMGIGAAIIVFFIIGFFVLLGLFLKGRGQSISDIGSPRPSAVAPSPTAPSEAPRLSGDASSIVITNNDWVKGNRDAKITVVEFSDLECPFCKRFHPTIQQLIQDYPDDVNWVYRHFPLDSLHRKSRQEAVATECAGELGGNDAFWSYVDGIFAITPSNDGLDPAQLPKIATDIGLDQVKFRECLNSGRYDQKIQENYNQAIQAGGSGTPFSVIVAGDQKIPVSGAVPYSQLKSIVDSVL